VNYRIEVYDTGGLRVGVYEETPLLEAVRTMPDRPDRIRGLLPAGAEQLGHGYRVRVLVEGKLFCEAEVTRVTSHWGDMKRLILDRYVNFRELIAFEAERPARYGDGDVRCAYSYRDVGTIVRDIINRTPGRLHYTVAHAAYPDGAQREYAKFLARKRSDNELEVGGVLQGQWVGGSRLDVSGAYAKDGDTIAGVKVDGAAWPDIRLMMIDAEETSLNSHAIKRHPELQYIPPMFYALSAYKVRADAATAALQALMDEKGIAFIELNPHRGEDGAYDDRVDAYGRYVGLVYGGGECFNAAMVEKGAADVYLYEDGKYHAPEMGLKDYFSYTGVNEDSTESPGAVVTRFRVEGGAYEAITALAYCAHGATWSVGTDLRVRFHWTLAGRARAVSYDAREVGVTLGSASGGVANALYFETNPLAGGLAKTYVRGESVDAYGYRGRGFPLYAIDLLEDADVLAEQVLNDVAYPELDGGVTFLNGDADVEVGDFLRIVGGPVRRMDRALPGEWSGRFAGTMFGRVKEVTHRFTGRKVRTTAALTSPVRSVNDPVSFMVSGQERESALRQFRLDSKAVGVDSEYHVD